MKVKVAVVHMEGRDLHWHQAFMKTQLTRQWSNWEEYNKALHARFGSFLFDDPMRELQKLWPRTSVQSYLDEFDLLLHRVHVSEEHAISFCLAILHDEIGNSVWIFQPKILREVFSLVRLQEHKMNAYSLKPAFSMVEWCHCEEKS